MSIIKENIIKRVYLLIAWIKNHRLVKDSVLMIFFALLSYLLGLVHFFIPGLISAQSDFREIPLLISIFYFSSPLFLIGMTFFSFFWLIPSVSFWSAFCVHAISLLVSCFFIKMIIKQNPKIVFLGILVLFYIGIVYYLCLIFPLQYVLHSFLGLSGKLSFLDFYENMIYSSRFEIVSTALIVALYIIQYKERKALKRHEKKLEEIVQERTFDLESLNEELISSNEELNATNEELYHKTGIINNQNSELAATINYLKKAQAQLLQVEKMASIGVLTSGVAHEINNPLNYIMGSYEGLKNYFEEENVHSQRIQLFLQSIKTGVDRISNIVQGLNQFGRTSEVYTEICDIRLIIENCLLMVHHQLKNRIEVSSNFEADSFEIMGNVGKLHQVFINILTNAIQAIEGRGKIELRVKKTDEYVQIEISDNGCGIKSENLPKITDPFFTTKNPNKGTGLGLSIVNTIISAHNGRIEFESEQQKGTKVIINLRLKNMNNEEG